MFTEVLDVSVALGRESIDYPGEQPFCRTVKGDLAAGDPHSASSLEMSAHAGTHIDAPAHFIAGGRTVDEYRPGELIMPAHVVEVADARSVGEGDLDGVDIVAGDAVLFRTENSRSGRCRSGVFSEDYVSVSPAAARICVAREARLVGIDYISVDARDSDGFPCHHELLGNGVLILEGLDLSRADAGKYTLICLPIKLAGADGAPVRAVLAR